MKSLRFSEMLKNSRPIFKLTFLFFIASLPLFLSSSIFFLKDPPVWPDEAFILDTAETFNQTGELATDIFGAAGMGLEKQALWYPPLYFYTLAAWIKVFGSTIESTRFLSLLLAFFALALVFFLIRKMFKENFLAVLGTALVAFDISFASSARMARMEMLCFFFQMVSLVIFYLIEQRKEKRYFAYLFVGVFSSLGILTHPLGLILPAVIFVYLLFVGGTLKERVLKGFLIALPMVLFIGSWLLSIRDWWDLFLLQNKLQLARKTLFQPYIWVLFSNILSWRLLFVLNGAVFYGLVRLVVKYRKKPDILLFLGLIISTAVLIWGKESWYTLYFQPFIALAILTILKRAKEDKEWLIFKSTVFIIILLFLINGWLYWETWQKRGRGNYDYHDLTQRVARVLPKQGKVFLAAIPDPYYDLKRESQLEFFEFSTVPVSDEVFQRVLDSSDYIVFWILDKRIIEYVDRNAETETAIQQPKGYKVLVIKLVPQDKRR